MPVDAGPHVVGVSFVREMWEPEGLPQPLQRGRVITNDQVYMGYANVGSVQIGGPYTAAGTAPRTRRAAARSSSVSRESPSDERACATKILSRMARLRLSPAGDEAGRADAARVLRRAAGATAAASTPAFSSRSSECWSIRTSCCACIAIQSRGDKPDALSPERPRARVAAVVLPVEQHPRRAAARSGRARAADAVRQSLEQRGAADAGRSARDATRSSTISPRSG